MPQKDRIVKNYYLEGAGGRGSIWTVWLSPEITGFNDIYFAGSGYRRPNSQEHGFLFHLSLHRDGRAHIKDQNKKIHQFTLTNRLNFPICSIYSHVDDLFVPLAVPASIIGTVTAIDALRQPNPYADKWCEIFFAHFERPRAAEYISLYTANDYGFSVIDRIDIGQDREILILFRFIRSTATTGAMPDLAQMSGYDHANRLTVWGIRSNNEKHVAVHDLAATNPSRVRGLYRKGSILRRLMTTVSSLAILS